MKMTMILGEFFGNETLTIEFKEFRFEMMYDFNSKYENTYKNPDELEKWIKLTIKIHIDKYLMKYIHAFNNSNLNGTIYFGISDEGEIIGYPIHKNNFKYIESIFKHYQSDNVDIKFHKVDINNYTNFFYPKSDEFIKQLNVMKKEYEEYEKDFNERKKIFLDELESIRMSINDLVNSGNNIGFKDYLKDNNVLHLLPEISENFEDTVIKDKKKDPNHILFWATNYRDEILNKVLENKPKKDYSKKKVDPYFKILLKFKPMVDYLISLDYTFYVIEVKVKPKKCILYTDKNTYFTRRISSQGDPCCIKECLV